MWLLYLLLSYCCHNHFILVVGMVVIYLLVSLYMWVLPLFVSMSLSGLHSIVDALMYGIFVGGEMYLVSLFCPGVNCVFIIFW